MSNDHVRRGGSSQAVEKKTEEKVEEDNDVKKKWIVFDFEWSQDEFIQCNEGRISYVEIETNPTVIPIHANKDIFQRR